MSVAVCVGAEHRRAIRRVYKHLPEFAVPTEFKSDHYYSPVIYLETYPIPDPKARLEPNQMRMLERLFVAAYDACKAKYRQDYCLATETPIYQLLRNNNPKIAGLPSSEGGQVVFLGDIAGAVRAECCSTQTRRETSASPSAGRRKAPTPVQR